MSGFQDDSASSSIPKFFAAIFLIVVEYYFKQILPLLMYDSVLVTHRRANIGSEMYIYMSLGLIRARGVKTKQFAVSSPRYNFLLQTYSMYTCLGIF